ncbi:MAG TPA: hypothetical protein VML75_24300, partial [Kofleriaceae bacterium]|nr:hypothetical protein [Kofleriaceae bacterium]
GNTPETSLARALGARFQSGSGPVLLIDGAIVDLEVYRLGSSIYGRAVVELRVARDEMEIYTARYVAGVRTRGPENEGGYLPLVWPALERQLAERAHTDERLATVLQAGGAR